MPKYEDFKVGDVWITRDGEEVTIIGVHSKYSSDYPIKSNVDSYTECGWRLKGREIHADLIRKKHEDQKRLDLSKPMRFRVVGTNPFTADGLENVPEPQKRVLKAWVVVDGNGFPVSIHSSEHIATSYSNALFSTTKVVAVEQEYVV